jgi:cell division protein FtsX
LASVPEELRVVKAFLDDPPSPQIVRSVRSFLASKPQFGAPSFRSSQEASRLVQKMWAGESWLADPIPLPAAVVAETSEPVDRQLIDQLRSMDGVVDVQVLGGQTNPDRLAAFRFAALDLCPGIDLPPPDPQ